MKRWIFRRPWRYTIRRRRLAVLRQVVSKAFSYPWDVDQTARLAPRHVFGVGAQLSLSPRHPFGVVITARDWSVRAQEVTARTVVNR